LTVSGEFVLDTPVVRAFVADVEGAIAGASSPVDACDAIRPRFAELLADSDWLPARYQEPAAESGMGGGIGQWLLHRAQDGSLSLFSLVVPPGAETPIHDHLAWGLVGLYRGTQDEEIYARRNRHARAGGEPIARARRLLRPHPAARRHPPRTHDLARDVGVDPPPDERHGVRLAARVRPGLRGAAPLPLGLRERLVRVRDCVA
jgi:predicted metal-dependent enzyme (double-stranded beta helix superfamily)